MAVVEDARRYLVHPCVLCCPMQIIKLPPPDHRYALLEMQSSTRGHACLWYEQYHRILYEQWMQWWNWPHPKSKPCRSGSGGAVVTVEWEFYDRNEQNIRETDVEKYTNFKFDQSSDGKNGFSVLILPFLRKRNGSCNKCGKINVDELSWSR